MKRIIPVTLLFSLLIFSAAAGKIVEKKYYFSDYQINEINDYQTINFQNTMLTGKTGEPLLPYHAISLLLPPGEIAKEIRIVGSQEEEIPGEYELYPRQSARPISKGKSKTAEIYSSPEIHGSRNFIKNTKIYDSYAQCPQELHGKLVTQFMNGYGFALCTFTPLKYFPASGKISYYKKVKIIIQTERNLKARKAMENLKCSNSVLERIKKLAQNKQEISQYPSIKIRNDEYQFLIITPQQYQDNFQELIDLYLVRGIQSEVATTEYIYANISGDDDQEKIRNYIIQEYQENSIQYALLGGDVEYVPFRGFYCTVQSGSGYVDDNIPADLYYSALDGSWNENGNELWGEIGEEDLLPEIAVARLSFSDVIDLENMLNKSINYQDDPVLGELDKPLLAGEHLWDNPLTWGGDYLDLLIGYHDDNGYITIGIPGR